MSPGPDYIHASKLNNIHPNSLSYLLSIFNSVSLQNIHPPFSKLAIIPPILKSSKDPSLSDSYRLIALTRSWANYFRKYLTKGLLVQTLGELEYAKVCDRSFSTDSRLGGVDSSKLTIYFLPFNMAFEKVGILSRFKRPSTTNR